MAEIILGIGTSHTPMLSMGADMWSVHAKYIDEPSDGFAALAAEAPDWLASEITPESHVRKYEESQAALGALEAALTAADPDVVLVCGDDQKEMFLDDGTPAFALFCGDEMLDLPHPGKYRSPGQDAAGWAYHGEQVEKYEVAGKLATHCAASLVADDFDITVLNAQASGRSIGHAFTFVRRRLMPNNPRPMIPVFINTFYSPNTPSAARCFALGRALRKAINAWPGNERVAVVASGGLSHFVVDASLDEKVMMALLQRDGVTLCSLRAEELTSGSSEIKNWVTAAGALDHLEVTYQNYIPAYRSLARTGVGLAATIWS